MSARKLDVFAHILPRAYLDALLDAVTDRGPLKRWLELPMLHDLDDRRRAMVAFEGYCQLLSLSSPSPDSAADPATAVRLARVANDAMAAVVDADRDLFPGFVAALPMSDTEAALVEAERALDELGAVGAQVYTNIAGRPLDDERYFPVLELFAERRRPIWLHPARAATFADYRAEDRSLFEIWWALGWPYETTAAMARLVFSGLLDRLPGLEVITHHMGGLTPMLEGRLALGLDQLGSRTSDADYGALLDRLERRPIDYFRSFYADTALFGSAPATRTGLEFFGVERCLFATDFPFDRDGGRLLISETIRAIESLGLDEADRASVYCGNAERLLRVNVGSEPG